METECISGRQLVHEPEVALRWLETYKFISLEVSLEVGHVGCEGKSMRRKKKKDVTTTYPHPTLQLMNYMHLWSTTNQS